MNCNICHKEIDPQFGPYGPLGEETCMECFYTEKEKRDRERGYEDCYGYFPGGDPRDFSPDYELCTPEEIAAWKADVALAESGNTVVCPPSGEWRFNKEGEAIIHILAPRYGIGIYKYRFDDEVTP